MFVLIDNNSGGVYAVEKKDTISKVVQYFEEKDDAERYIGLLDADDYEDKLEVFEVNPDVIAFNCSQYGYQYTVISPNDFVIPDIL